MSPKILLTSFDTWQPDQNSNSSDDLLAKVSEITSLPYSLSFLRKLPVDYELAPIWVIAQINQFQPDIIICCGMAKSREKLTVESGAGWEHDILKTAVNLEQLVTDLPITEISHDAGKFVCEALYYRVLKHIYESQIATQCIFVHVPVLNADNIDNIVGDFLLLTRRLSLSYQ
ncbi:MAG: peptidase C15 [Microcoleus sp. CSU_2_2]|nr:peptidase C15 [Microcoleus sp. SU_5_3]NJS11172.1 peptidase C15 [Microcoleus sp. CSU_2_2]